jgi:hypothetical protein
MHVLTRVDQQEAALAVVSEESFCSVLNAVSALEQQLLPRVCWLVVKSSQLSCRVNALMCLAKTFQHLPITAVITKVCISCYLCIPIKVLLPLILAVLRTVTK